MDVLGLTQNELATAGVLVVALGYVGQWVKSVKDFPTWGAHLLVAAVGPRPKSFMATRMRRCEGLSPSRTSGRARLTMTDWAYVR